jgi:hypothetical protein
MAGKGKKTFVAGEVLLAQDVNEYLMDQSVMNFASSAARSSAIPTPTEGMTTYVQDRNQIETFDGAEYRGMSGLQLVKKQTIETAVSAVTVTDAFSATYENYKIMVSGGASSVVTNATLKLGASATGYFQTRVNLLYAAAATNFGSDNNTAQWNVSGVSLLGANGINGSLELTAPFLAKHTGLTASDMRDATAGMVVGLHKVATSFTDFTLTATTGTMTGGTIYVYGYGT